MVTLSWQPCPESLCHRPSRASSPPSLDHSICNNILWQLHQGEMPPMRVFSCHQAYHQSHRTPPKAEQPSSLVRPKSEPTSSPVTALDPHPAFSIFNKTFIDRAIPPIGFGPPEWLSLHTLPFQFISQCAQQSFFINHMF